MTTLFVRGAPSVLAELSVRIYGGFNSNSICAAPLPHL